MLKCFSHLSKRQWNWKRRGHCRRLQLRRRMDEERQLVVDVLILSSSLTSQLTPRQQRIVLHRKGVAPAGTGLFGPTPNGISIGSAVLQSSPMCPNMQTGDRTFVTIGRVAELVPRRGLIMKRQWYTAGSAPGTPCTMDSSTVTAHAVI